MTIVYIHYITLSKPNKYSNVQYISDEEKKKTEKAFHDFLPPSVVIDIKSKRVFIAKLHHYKYIDSILLMSSLFGFQQTAERFECVTIFFGDIVGFNLMTADCNAIEVRITRKTEPLSRTPLSLADRGSELLLQCVGRSPEEVPGVSSAQHGG